MPGYSFKRHDSFGPTFRLNFLLRLPIIFIRLGSIRVFAHIDSVVLKVSFEFLMNVKILCSSNLNKIGVSNLGTINRTMPLVMQMARPWKISLPINDDMFLGPLGKNSIYICGKVYPKNIVRQTS